MADGKIRIETRIDNSKAEKDLEDLEKTVDACSRHMKDAFESVDSVKGCEKAIQRQVNAYQKAKEKASEYEKQIEQVNAQLREKEDSALKNANVGFSNDTPEKIQDRADNLLSNDKDYNKLIEQSAKLQDSWYAQNEKMVQANSNVEALESKMDRLKNKMDATSKSTSRMSRVFSGLKGIGSKIKDVFVAGFGKAGSVAGNFFKGIGNSTANSIKSIKRMGLAILGIRAAYSLVRKAADQYLESNQSASNQIAAIWNTLGAMIGPIVDMVISGVVTALSYINALIKALTGIDFVARANSKALKKQSTATKGVAKATKEANAQLASFDEMNKLEDKNSGGSSGGGGGAGTGLFEPVNVDTSWIDGLKEAFDKGAYELGKYLGESLNDALRKINWDKIKSTAQDIGRTIALFLNGAIDGIDWKLLGSTIGEGLNTVLNFAYGFITTFNFRGFGEALGTAFDSCFKTIDWNMLAETISKGFIGIFNSISGFVRTVDWQNIGKTLVDCILSIDWGGMISAVVEAVYFLLRSLNDVLVGAFIELVAQLPRITESIYQWVSSIDWNSLGSTAAEYAVQIIGQLIDVILNTDWVSVVINIAKIIGSATLGIIDFVVGYVQSVLDAIWNAITKSFNYNDFLKWVEGVVKSIQDGIKDINTWINDKFMQARQAIYDIFGKIGDWFKERYNDICNAFESVNTWFKDKFDKAIKGVKDAFSSIGKWFTDRRNEINSAFSSVGTWFSEKFTTAWNLIKGIFSPSAVSTFFAGCWKNIKGAFGSVSGWFKGTFADAWQAVKNVFSSGGKVFDGIKDGILNGLKVVINALINGINRVIKIPFDGINNALKTIKSTNILGIKPFSWIGTISVPSIPKLAKGGIVNNPTMFQAGEAGKEAVLPLQNNTQWMQDLADFINSQRDENEGNQEINLYIDGERFFRWFIKKYKQWQLQTNG